MSDLLHGLALSVAAYALAGIVATCTTARAQDSGDQRLPNPPASVASPRGDHVPVRVEDTGLLLARLCANEAGLPLSDDCAAIDHVLRVRASASGRTYSDVLHRYQRHAGALDPGRTDARRWIAFLAPDGAEPPGWQLHLRWSRHQPRWLALYEQAQAILAGEVPSPCDVEPDHWGAPHYLERPRRGGWVRVDCGYTRNVFWRMPERS